jgi:hypothetical protein
MGGSDRKTNLQKWEEMCEELAKQQLRKEKMKKKDGPMYPKVVETIERLENCIKVFESVKDDELPLSDGTKSFCSALYADVKYGKWNPTKDIGNKYTSKGKHAEEASIDLISRLEKQLYVKNELLIQNDFLRGTPDVIVGDPYNANLIVDAKSPWDCETFFVNLNDELPDQYKFQMQGYMAISGAPMAEVHFCLVDIPDFMWEKERMNLFKRMEVLTEESIEFKMAEAQLFRNLHFGDMPFEERRVKFTVHRDEELIQKIYNQVKKVREYLPVIEKRHLLGPDNVILSEISEIIETTEDNS